MYLIGDALKWFLPSMGEKTAYYMFYFLIWMKMLLNQYM